MPSIGINTGGHVWEGLCLHSGFPRFSVLSEGHWTLYEWDGGRGGEPLAWYSSPGEPATDVSECVRVCLSVLIPEYSI